MDLDVNKIIAKLGTQISQLSVQNAALLSQIEAYEELLEEQKSKLRHPNLGPTVPDSISKDN